MAIDLHIHTIYSDGSKTPDEIIMKSSHLEAISITDHDSIEAYHNIDFNKLECKLIPGLEITTFLPYEVHILGYFDKIPDKLFRNELNINNIQRAKEIFYIVKKMYEANYISLSVQQMLKKYKVIRLEYIYNELNDKMISKEDFYYDNSLIGGETIGKSAEEIVEFIHRYGGIASIAHPYRLRVDFDLEQNSVDKLILNLKHVGMDAIECYHESHCEDDIKYYLNLARNSSMQVTGGSDYHGISKPEIEIGIGRGNLNVPHEIINNMVFRRECNDAGMYY